jgi:MFS family permease
MNEPASVADSPASLWRNHNFTRLWFANVVSNAGTQITNLALPLTAALTLAATPSQMGLLAMAGSLPNLLFGLFAGVWVDRTRRRPILIWADLGRALLLGSIPLAALMGSLTFIHLWVVAFAAATLSIFFTIASVAVLPSVVKSSQLVEANSKFALTDSVLSIAGPSTAGGIVQLLSAPKAIIVDAFSYILSALSLGSINLAEKPARPKPIRGQLWIEIREGVHALIQTPLLRALTISGMVGVIGFAIQGAVGILFLTRTLGLGPALIGLLSTCGGGGALLGAVVAGRVGRRIGIGIAVILGNFLWILGGLMTPLAGFADTAFPYLVVGTALASLGATIFSVNQMSLRQHLTPIALLGRVTAARRFLIFSLAPLGSAVGGALGTVLGLQTTLLIGGLVGMVSVVVVFFSPLRTIRDLPQTATSGS